MAPVVRACRSAPDFEPIVCLTGQHREMLDQVVQYFDLPVDRDLKLMQPNQSLAGLTARCLEGIDSLITEYKPHCLVAQGDTTTVMAAAVAAFYRRTPFVHVEAGLRTDNLEAPWPEEFNRRVASVVTTLHCAPTARAAENLIREGADPTTVHVTGNSVIDALLWTLERERNNSHAWQNKYSFLRDRDMVLITGHRRENFGSGFENICKALAQLAARFSSVEFVYPVHLNPNVRTPVHNWLHGIKNLHLIDPAPYPEFVWLMDRAKIILSDSGGVQEEAPSLRKPVLVMRDTTERPEAVEAGAVELVGTCAEKIVSGVTRLLTDPKEYAKRQVDKNPYGDGHAAERIVNLMLARGWHHR